LQGDLNRRFERVPPTPAAATPEELVAISVLEALCMALFGRDIFNIYCSVR
jgi:hypothetical protein